MSLRHRDGESPDPYLRGLLLAPSASHLLLSLSDLPAGLAQRQPGQALGVEINNTTKAEALLPYLDQLTLIAIGFPSFADGRGFSIARSLRNLGFRGRLRAVGPLIADQFAYALACGFDEVEVPADLAQRQPMAQWLAALGAMRGSYQPSYASPAQSILHRRRAGRQP